MNAKFLCKESDVDRKKRRLHRVLNCPHTLNVMPTDRSLPGGDAFRRTVAPT
jgi:hypothetical protein